MTGRTEGEPGLDGHTDALDVTLQRVGGRRATRPIALVVAVVAIVVGVGIAGNLVTGSGPSPRPSGSAVAAGASGESSLPSGDSSNRTVEAGSPAVAGILPELPNDDLPLAPRVVFLRRDGDDLERWAWQAGAPLAMEDGGRFVGAYAGYGDAEPIVATFSPTGRVAVVRELTSISDPGSTDRVRVVGDDGSVLLSRDDVRGWPFAPVWSLSGYRGVVAGPAGTWLLLEVAGRRLVAQREVAQVPQRVDPAPAGQRPIQVPVGFAANGEWMYVGSVNPLVGAAPIAVARISTADGTTEAIGAFPDAGPDALEVAPGALYTDPVSGRRIDPFLPYANQPTDLRVREPDGREAFTLHFEALVGAMWTGTGSLLVLEADRFPESSWTRLVEIDAAGRAGRPMIETGPLGYAELLGVQDGHALISYGGPGQPELVLWRLADRATATLRLSERDAVGLQPAGWASP
jgi:hypothetical protein